MRFWRGALRTQHGNKSSATRPRGPFGASPASAAAPSRLLPPHPARPPALPAAPRRGRPATGRIRWAAPSPSAPSGLARGTPWLLLLPLPPPGTRARRRKPLSTAGARKALWDTGGGGRSRRPADRRLYCPPPPRHTPTPFLGQVYLKTVNCCGVEQFSYR